VLTSPSFEKRHELDALGVWMNIERAVIDRNCLEDIEICYDGYYTVASVEADGVSLGSGAYTVDGDALILSAEALASALTDGIHNVTVRFTDGSKEYVSGIEIKLTRFYDVSFDVDGSVSVSRTEQGSIPTAPSDTYKSADAQYSYSFVGWDADGDGAADTIDTVDSDIRYTAVYTRERNEYTVTWMVDGERYRENYLYGEIPSFDGSTAKDSTVRVYEFVGWNKEITEVSGNVTYTAQYASYRFGDYDRDGALSNVDLTLLVRYLAGFDVDGAHSLNGDDKINNRDAIALIRKLSDWE
jgi:hypothetical protein